MSDITDPQYLPITELARLCRQETERFFHPKSDDPKSHDPRYCLELFRRAIVIRDEEAWEALCAQYQSQVERWVYKHRYFPLVSKHEEAQDFIAQAFERFWIYFTPARLAESQSLAAVLKYLQTCVNGAMTDSWRKLSRRQFEQETEDEVQSLPELRPTPEDLLQINELWQHIKTQSKDQKEYVVLYASFILRLSPREILAEYPDLFSDIKEIYQYKANALDRFEDDPEIGEFFQRS